MTVAATLTRLHEIARALPRSGCDWEERPRFDPPASAQSVDELERVAGFSLPRDLREFLKENESIVAMSIHNGYWLGGIEQLVKSAGERRLQSISDTEPMIPVATDGGGNAFLLGASGRVWRLHQETNKMEMIAASFGAFLERVAEDWSAYVADKPGWRFLV